MARNPQTSYEGYLMIDHRASPGLPANFYDGLPWRGMTAAEGKLAESAVMVCRHCQQHVVKNLNRTRERGYCRRCDGYICDICELNSRAADYVHAPFKKIIDDVLEAGAKGLAPSAASGMLTFAPAFAGNTHLPLMTAKDQNDG
jgi:hypothetical protein